MRMGSAKESLTRRLLPAGTFLSITFPLLPLPFPLPHHLIFLPISLSYGKDSNPQNTTQNPGKPCVLCHQIATYLHWCRRGDTLVSYGTAHVHGAGKGIMFLLKFLGQDQAAFGELSCLPRSYWVWQTEVRETEQQGKRRWDEQRVTVVESNYHI